jgi:hypothetical protein
MCCPGPIHRTYILYTAHFYFCFGVRGDGDYNHSLTILDIICDRPTVDYMQLYKFNVCY